MIELDTQIIPTARAMPFLFWACLAFKVRKEFYVTKLNEMCDIVGCRVIASDIEAVRQISAAIENRLNVKPETGVKDYIAHPKLNGYRSTHVISRHDAPEAGLTNLFCETQVRTRLQHAWATALETYDAMSRNALKFGGESKKGKRPFASISNAFAIKEGPRWFQKHLRLGMSCEGRSFPQEQ